jgi:hypothetical protein
MKKVAHLALVAARRILTSQKGQDYRWNHTDFWPMGAVQVKPYPMPN